MLVLGKQVCVTQALAYANLCNVASGKVNTVLGSAGSLVLLGSSS